MRDSVKRRYAVAAVILLSSPLLCVDCASASSERAYLIAQADPGQADQGQAGTITPEKIRSVVEITLRQRWQPAALAEGASTEAEFRVTSAGQIEGVSIRNSAGNSDFDRACVAAIEKTAPLPALPSYLGLNQLAFGATFHTGNQPWVELRLLDGAQRSAQNPSNQSQLMQPSAGALQASAGNINEIGTQMGLPEQGANTAPSGGQTGGTSPAANQTQQPSGSGTNDINQ